jgi:hypothetical protein
MLGALLMVLPEAAWPQEKNVRTPIPITLNDLGLSESNFQILKTPGISYAEWTHPINRDVFILVRQNQETVIYRSGDFQVYIRDLNTLENLSRSINRGATHGAYPLIKDSTLHLFGGYGLWRNFQDEIFFSLNSQEWEMYRTCEGPTVSRVVIPHYFSIGDSIYRVSVPGFLENNNQKTVAKIHQNQGVWESIGTLGPFTQLESPKRFIETHQFICTYTSEKRFFICAKEDLLMRESKDPRACEAGWNVFNSPGIRAIRGNQIELWQAGRMVHSMDLSTLYEQAVPMNISLFRKIGDATSAGGKSLTKAQDNQIGNLDTKWILALVGLGLTLAIAGWIAGRSRTRSQVPFQHRSTNSKSTSNTEMRMDSPALKDRQHWSPELALIVDAHDSVLSTHEFDELMGLTDDISPETIRVRRAKLVKDIQIESTFVFGKNILTRERDSVDGRRVVYRIAQIPA